MGMRVEGGRGSGGEGREGKVEQPKPGRRKKWVAQRDDIRDKALKSYFFVLQVEGEGKGGALNGYWQVRGEECEEVLEIEDRRGKGVKVMAKETKPINQERYLSPLFLYLSRFDCGTVLYDLSNIVANDL